MAVVSAAAASGGMTAVPRQQRQWRSSGSAVVAPRLHSHVFTISAQLRLTGDAGAPWHFLLGGQAAAPGAKMAALWTHVDSQRQSGATSCQGPSLPSAGQWRSPCRVLSVLDAWRSCILHFGCICTSVAFACRLRLHVDCNCMSIAFPEPPLRPCVGADAASLGLVRQGWLAGRDFVPRYVFDVNGWLRSCLLRAHGPQALTFHLGEIEGNLLEENIFEWGRVDYVLSGPPCVPFSAIGRRAGFADDHARVFACVTDIVVSQGHKGCYGCIIEQVPGLDHHQKTGGGSPWDLWVAEVLQRAPMWQCSPWFLNTRHWLPQSRPRIYTVFTNKFFMAHPVPPPLPDPHAATLRMELIDVLHMGLRPNQEDRLTAQQQQNLWRTLAMVPAHARQAGRVWTMSVDRNPDKAFPVMERYDEVVGTLRAKNEMVWVVVWGPGGESLKLSRCLHPLERCTLQGFPAEIATELSKRQTLEMAGNAFSVPVMAAALWACMHALVGVLPPKPIPAALTDSATQVLQAALCRQIRREIALAEQASKICEQQASKICEQIRHR